MYIYPKKKNDDNDDVPIALVSLSTHNTQIMKCVPFINNTLRPKVEFLLNEHPSGDCLRMFR